MEYVNLSRRRYGSFDESKLTLKPVSKLCFGSLAVTSAQADISAEQGSGVIAYALSRGINFIDTAQYYQNYHVIRDALRKSRMYDTVISTKTYAHTKALAEKAVDEARSALDRDYIDIFMLHEQESIHTLRGHMEALDYLLECREKGIVLSVGASMHHVAAVEGVCELRDRFGRDMDVIHPIYNVYGLGICDGDAGAMLEAMTKAKSRYGMAVFSMKPLGGGHLCKYAASAFDFVLETDCVDAVAAGMQSEDEVDANIGYFENRVFPEPALEKLSLKHRELRIEKYCEGCGKCAERCGHRALSVENGRAVCDHEKCVLCGYCAKVCPVFALKVW